MGMPPDHATMDHKPVTLAIDGVERRAGPALSHLAGELVHVEIVSPGVDLAVADFEGPHDGAHRPELAVTPVVAFALITLDTNSWGSSK